MLVGFIVSLHDVIMLNQRSGVYTNPDPDGPMPLSSMDPSTMLTCPICRKPSLVLKLDPDAALHPDKHPGEIAVCEDCFNKGHRKHSNVGVDPAVPGADRTVITEVNPKGGFQDRLSCGVTPRQDNTQLPPQEKDGRLTWDDVPTKPADPS